MLYHSYFFRTDIVLHGHFKYGIPFLWKQTEKNLNFDDFYFLKGLLKTEQLSQMNPILPHY